MKTLNDPSKDAIARENWHRYEYGRDHGHMEYITTARKNEGFYLGGGEQWDEDVKAQLEAALDEFGNVFQPTAGKGRGAESAAA